MPSFKTQPINLNEVYPCPCCRRGELQLIVLTEALGCAHCQKIFVVQPNDYTIEQLSTTYPYKRSWQWTGQQWIIPPLPMRRRYISLAMVMMGLAGIIVLFMGQGLVVWPTVVVLALSGFLLMLWLACRR